MLLVFNRLYLLKKEVICVILDALVLILILIIVIVALVVAVTINVAVFPPTILDDARVVVLSGSVEIAPRLGQADAICDLVSSGATLAANQLKPVLDILQSEAVLAGPVQPFGDVRAELYLGYGAEDPLTPAKDVDAMRAALAKTAVRHEVEIYPGATHGFVFPGRAGAYHKPHAERHWERLFDLFRRNLA